MVASIFILMLAYFLASMQPRQEGSEISFRSNESGLALHLLIRERSLYGIQKYFSIIDGRKKIKHILLRQKLSNRPWNKIEAKLCKRKTGLFNPFE